MDKFIFKSELWVPQSTGVVVDTLEGFRKAIATLDEDTLYYHLYRNTFEYHFLIPTYSNSFAYWFSDNGQFILAEKFPLSIPWSLHPLADVRAEMSRICLEAGEDRRRFMQPLYFVRTIRQVVDLGIEAVDLNSFITGFKSIGIISFLSFGHGPAEAGGVVERFLPLAENDPP